MPPRSGGPWRPGTDDRPAEVSVAIQELRRRRVIAGSHPTGHHVPGSLTEIPIMYIPMINWVRGITEKSKMNAVLSHLFNVRIRRGSAGRVFVCLKRSDWFTIQETMGSLDG